mgnify:CR=1 FL=1
MCARFCYRVITHQQQIHEVSKSFLGWFSCSYHPDIAHSSFYTPRINKTICDQYYTKPEFYDSISKNVRIDPPPEIHLSIVKPRWNEHRSKVWQTRATGVYGPTKHARVLKQLITDIQTKSGSISFINKNIQYSIREQQAEYGKAISMHQTFLRDHEKHVILNTPYADMNLLHPKLQKISGIAGIFETKDSHNGKWHLLTRKTSHPHSLKQIDSLLEITLNWKKQIILLSGYYFNGKK